MTKRELREIADTLEDLDKRLGINVQLGKHAAYVKAEFAEIRDTLQKRALELHKIADSITGLPPV